MLGPEDIQSTFSLWQVVAVIAVIVIAMYATAKKEKKIIEKINSKNKSK